MTLPVREPWERALASFESARILRDHGQTDDAASRAYYAAFHAVSALFGLEGRSFRKHSALEAAVHRDLVKPGRWPAELGEAYSKLLNLRETGDYGEQLHVTADTLDHALAAARRLLDAVRSALPADFPPIPEDPPRGT